MLFFPVLVGSAMIQYRMSMGIDGAQNKSNEDSSKLAIEAITNIRTIAGLRAEQRYCDQYYKILEGANKSTLSDNLKRGFIYGSTFSVQNFGFGLSFLLTTHLVVDKCLDWDDAFVVIIAIIFGSQMIGFAFAFTADMTSAFVASGNIFMLLDRVPKIDSRPESGSTLPAPGVTGNITIRDGVFCYPTRPGLQVLKKLNLNVERGTKVALVGASGCGKSTVIQLLQRFYDLDSGSLAMEGQDTQGLNIPSVRANLGIVSQEPTLFDMSIAENIQFGDNSRTVTMEEVISAARRANVHNFVTGLPNGYDTSVGSKGTQLSGGQKQRIAIARALVRNPKVLLLDEATSALDSESEKIVQDALDAAVVGRTSITIAHRLTTIKDSDKILVFDKGAVVEEGNHEELLDLRGIYFRLWNSS